VHDHFIPAGKRLPVERSTLASYHAECRRRFDVMRHLSWTGALTIGVLFEPGATLRQRLFLAQAVAGPVSSRGTSACLIAIKNRTHAHALRLHGSQN